jgi:hypothetical protein
MATLTEIVTAIVVQSSAAAYSHFGVAVELKQPERPVPAVRTVARVTPARAVKPDQDCPETRAKVIKA